MPQLSEYKYTGPLDCNIEVDTSSLKGKSVIVTGGANGIGEQYVRAFVKAGAFVTFGDIDEVAGQKLAAEFPENALFTRCDVTKWEDQLTLFKEAISASPSKSCDIVIANAGIAVSDAILEPEDADEPTKPSLSTTEINVIGVLYTIKLARFYFNKKVDSEERDRCLILQGSIAGYIDQPGVLQYNASKFHLRGMMRTLRRMAHLDHIRVNLIAPWYIRTNIIGDVMEKSLDDNGVPFAETVDAASAVLRIATDRSVAGYSLGILPRKYAPKGFVDLDYDEYEEGELLDELTKLCIQASPFLNPPKL